jgi:hypothetical protein
MPSISTERGLMADPMFAANASRSATHRNRIARNALRREPRAFAGAVVARIGQQSGKTVSAETTPINMLASFTPEVKRFAQGAVNTLTLESAELHLFRPMLKKLFLRNSSVFVPTVLRRLQHGTT